MNEVTLAAAISLNPLFLIFLHIAVVSSSKIDRLKWYFLLMERLYTLKEAKMLLGVTTKTIQL